MNIITAAAAVKQQDNWPVAIETIVLVIAAAAVVIAYFRYRQ